MSKFTPNTFTNLNNETSFINQLNANFSTLQTLLDTVVSRDGTTPNTMTADFDVNSQDVLNVNNAYVQTLFINGSEVVPTDLANVPATEIPVGTVGAPGLAVDGDADTGFFQDTLNTLAISIGGSEVFRAKSTGIDVVGDVICTDDMSCDRITAASMTITTGGLVISAGGLNVTGTVTLPSHTLANGTIATTQSASDNSTKVATTAYVEAAVAAVGASPAYARGYLNSAQIVPTATVTTVAYDAETYDTASCYDIATNKGRFTAATTGYYLVTGAIHIDATSWGYGKYPQLYIYKDGSVHTQAEQYIAYETASPGNMSHAINLIVSDIVYLTAGAYVDVRFWHNKTGDATIVAGTSKSYMSVAKL